MPFDFRRAGLGLGAFLLQWMVLGRLSIYGSTPDVVLLYIAWYALQTNRRAGAIAGFLLGTALDVAYGTWGIHMFVKTLVGFLLGTFAVDERDALLIQPQQAFLGGLTLALLHNGLLVTLLALQTSASNDFLIASLWLGAAAYTACVATLLSVLQS
jgi:rod shape-determining protein MreD